MRPKTRATIEDLYKVEGKAELVNGEIVEMPPSGDEPSAAGLQIAMRLYNHAQQTGQGRHTPMAPASMSIFPIGPVSNSAEGMRVIRAYPWHEFHRSGKEVR